MTSSDSKFIMKGAVVEVTVTFFRTVSESLLEI